MAHTACYGRCLLPDADMAFIRRRHIGTCPFPGKGMCHRALTKYRKSKAFIRNDGAHEGRAQCAKQAVVSPMNKGVLQALRRSRTTIANCGVHVISGIFCRANACEKVKARRAEVASTRSAQARNTAQAKRRGARRPPPVAETGRSKPNEAGRATSELASAVERPC